MRGSCSAPDVIAPSCILAVLGSYGPSMAVKPTLARYSDLMPAGIPISLCRRASIRFTTFVGLGRSGRSLVLVLELVREGTCVDLAADRLIPRRSRSWKQRVAAVGQFQAAFCETQRIDSETGEFCRNLPGGRYVLG